MKMIHFLILNSSGIHGHIFPRNMPINNVKDKFYMPKFMYKEKYYPSYVRGMGYIISNYTVEPLVEGIGSYSGYILIFEDLFVTGIIAEKTGVPRYHSRFFDSDVACSNKCILSKIPVLLGCDDSMKIKQMWINWMKNKKNCQA